jgi:hypothetical protein
MFEWKARNMAANLEMLDFSNRRPPLHTYRADAQLLSGHLKHPVELKIERQAEVTLRGRRATRVFRQMRQFNADGMISFQSGYTCASGSYSQQHGWRTLSTAVLEGLAVFEVITAARAVAQVSTEHPYNKGRIPEYVPRVTFLGTRFEDLRVGGYPVQIEFDLGICGDKPVDDRSYLEDPSFLDRVRDQLERIAYANDLPRDLREKYDSEIAAIHYLKGANLSEKAGPNEYPSLHCSLVRSISPIPIPGVLTIGNLIVIPDFGIVSLADVEVGVRPDLLQHLDDNFFSLTMLRMRMGSIAEGIAMAAHASLGGTTVTAGAGGLSDQPPLASSNLSEEEPEVTEGTSVTRYPKIDLAVENRPTRQVLLTIDLALLPDPRTESGRVTVTAPQGWTELRIQTEITAPDLRFELGQASGTIVVHNHAWSESYRVKAWVTGDIKEQDAIEVRATFYYEGRNCGSARRAFPISELLRDTPSRTVTTPDVEAATTVHALEGQLQAGKIADKVLSMGLPKQSVIPESRREVPPIGYTTGSMEAPLVAKPSRFIRSVSRNRDGSPGIYTCLTTFAMSAPCLPISPPRSTWTRTNRSM